MEIKVPRNSFDHALSDGTCSDASIFWEVRQFCLFKKVFFFAKLAFLKILGPDVYLWENKCPYKWNVDFRPEFFVDSEFFTFKIIR